MKPLKLIIPLPPITKKNSQRILLNHNTGKHFIAQSEQYKTYENNCLWVIKRISEPINTPVNVKCTFYVKTNGKCDLVGHLQSVDDILVRAGILLDDNYRIVAGHDGSRVYVDKDNPRTEIEITDLEE